MIERGGPDRLWTYADFRSLPMAAVAAALSRLAGEGTIRRVRKGVYYVPRSTRFGETVPDADAVAVAVLRSRGVKWKPTGPAAYNGLGLTTQVSPTTTFAVDRNVRSLRVGIGAKVRLRPASVVRGLESEERAALDALRDIRRIPDTSAGEAVLKLKDLLVSRRLSFNRLAIHARREPARVRALLGAIGSALGAKKTVLLTLGKSLNPTTSYRLDVANVLPAAREWHIR